MALKLTTTKQSNEYNELFNNYTQYYKLLINENDEYTYQYQLFNIIANKMIIRTFNQFNSLSLKRLKDLMDDDEKKDFKNCGFKLNNKLQLVKWNMCMPEAYEIGNIDTIRDEFSLKYILYMMGKREEVIREYLDEYVFPNHIKIIKLMRDLKPFLKQLKDNTIICKNEEIFTIILLAKNDMRIDYCAMKNIISYL